MSAVLLLICLTFALPLTTAAKNSVPSMNLTVELQPNGDGRITQVWTGSFHEGTEVYLPIENLGDMDIDDFTVSDSHGEFENIGKWDVDASFDDKAHKCGIVTTGSGYELCFGISEYGNNTYTFSYTVTGLVGTYTDGYDGFLFQFVNPGMSVFPTNVTLRILAPEGTVLSADNSGIWAFGYEGTIVFDNGTVLAQTDSPLDGSSSSCIIMLRLDSGLLTPHRVAGGSFEQLKQNAFRGSSYEEVPHKITFMDVIMYIIMGLFALLIAALVIGTVCYIIYRIVIYVKARNHIKSADYYRDIPCDGDLERSFAMARPFGMTHEQSLLSALLLRMMAQGYISTSPQADSPKKMEMKFITTPPEQDEHLLKLYEALHKACPNGSDTATQDQLKKYITNHFTSIEQPLNLAETYGRKKLRQMNCYVRPNKSDRVHGLNDLTPEGIAQLDQLAGFYNFLRDFTLMKERTTIEVALWKEYMVYATLLEVAQKTMDELRKVAPYYDPEIQEFDNSMTNFIILNAIINSSYQSGYNAAHSVDSSGRGGGASFGGGGGFSGGGFGGGTR